MYYLDNTFNQTMDKYKVKYMFGGHQIKFRQQISFTWLTTSCASNLTSLYSIEISDKIVIRSITDVKKNDFTLLSSTDKK